MGTDSAVRRWHTCAGWASGAWGVQRDVQCPCGSGQTAGRQWHQLSAAGQLHPAGPQALGLLAFSQSSEAASPYASDQTRAFSAKRLAPIPFTEAQIKADPQYRQYVISEGTRLWWPAQVIESRRGAWRPITTAPNQGKSNGASWKPWSSTCKAQPRRSQSPSTMRRAGCPSTTSL